MTWPGSEPVEDGREREESLFASTGSSPSFSESLTMLSSVDGLMSMRQLSVTSFACGVEEAVVSRCCARAKMELSTESSAPSWAALSTLEKNPSAIWRATRAFSELVVDSPAELFTCLLREIQMPPSDRSLPATP